MGEPQVVQILAHGMGQFAVVQECAVFAAPRPQVRLVDHHRRIESIACRARFHPCAIAPFMLERPCSRCGGGRTLTKKSYRIRLVQQASSIAGHDPVLISLSVLYARYDAFPDAGAIGPRRQGIRACVPAVPFPDHRHRGRIRGPDGEARARASVQQMTPQHAVQVRLRSLPEEIDVLFTRHGATASVAAWLGSTA